MLIWHHYVRIKRNQWTRKPDNPGVQWSGTELGWGNGQ